MVLRDVWDYLRVEFRFVCGFEAIVICIKTASPRGIGDLWYWRPVNLKIGHLDHPIKKNTENSLAGDEKGRNFRPVTPPP